MIMKTASIFVLALAVAGCAATPPPSRGPLRDGTVSVGLGGHARFVGLDVAPLRVEEDSRCPTGVQCIQAGTVRLLVRIADRRGRRDATLTLGKPIALEAGGWLGLAAVCPYPRHPERIARNSYRFTLAFRVQPPPNPLELPCVG
jgi:hypothetical protein